MSKERELLKEIGDLLKERNIVGLFKNNELVNKIESFLSEPEWKPIETAPKNGKRILVIGKQYGKYYHHIAIWSDDRWWICGNDKINISSWVGNPYYWRELPEPPEVKHG